MQCNDKEAVNSIDDANEPKIIISSLQEQICHNKIISKNAEPTKKICCTLVEFTYSPKRTRHTRPVKTRNIVETPRHVLIAFRKK